MSTHQNQSQNEIHHVQLHEKIQMYYRGRSKSILKSQNMKYRNKNISIQQMNTEPKQFYQDLLTQQSTTNDELIYDSIWQKNGIEQIQQDQKNILDEELSMGGALLVSQYLKQGQNNEIIQVKKSNKSQRTESMINMSVYLQKQPEQIIENIQDQKIMEKQYNRSLNLKLRISTSSHDNNNNNNSNNNNNNINNNDLNIINNETSAQIGVLKNNKSGRESNGIYNSIKIRNRKQFQVVLTNDILGRTTQLYNQYKNDLILIISGKNIIQTIDFTCMLMEKCIERNLMDFFMHVTSFLGLYCLDLQEFSKAAFFQNQYKLMAEMNQNFRCKTKALFNLANIGSRQYLYESSIKILKKALEYSWLCRDIDLELDIYERIGQNYFYLGMIQEATFYHNKFILGDTELDTSPIKAISCSLIKRDIKQNKQQPITDITREFLLKLSLPVLNRFELDAWGEQLSQRTRFLCQAAKSITYLNARLDYIIEKLLAEPEYTNYQLDRPLYGKLKNTFDRQNKLGILNCSSIHMKNTEKINEIMNDNVNKNLDFTFADSEKLNQGFKLNHHIIKSLFSDTEIKLRKQPVPVFVEKDPYNYKVPLQRIMDERQKLAQQSKHRMDAAKFRIINNIGRGVIQSKQRVFINHISEQKQKQLDQVQYDQKFLVKKYIQFFDNFIKSL